MRTPAQISAKWRFNSGRVQDASPQQGKRVSPQLRDGVSTMPASETWQNFKADRMKLCKCVPSFSLCISDLMIDLNVSLPKTRKSWREFPIKAISCVGITSGNCQLNVVFCNKNCTQILYIIFTWTGHKAEISCIMFCKLRMQQLWHLR